MKKLASLIATIVIVSTLTATLGQAQATADTTTQPVAYIMAKAFYREVSYRAYHRVFQQVRDKRGGIVGDVMQHAAVTICETNRQGTLRDNFSCTS